MSKVLNIKKALRLEALLKDSFKDTPGVNISVHAIADQSISIHATYEGTELFQTISDGIAYTATVHSDRVYVRDLYRLTLHPLDHWVDVQVQCERNAEQGIL